MGFLQQFHLVINYKNGSTNKFIDMPSRPLEWKLIALGNLTHLGPFTHDAYIDAYIEDGKFKEVFQKFQSQTFVDNRDNIVDYHLQNGLLYKLHKIFVPKGEWLYLITNSQTFEVAWHFGLGMTMEKL